LDRLRPQRQAGQSLNPTGPAYTAAERATMILDTTRRVTHDADRDARLLWTRGVRN